MSAVPHDVICDACGKRGAVRAHADVYWHVAAQRWVIETVRETCTCMECDVDTGWSTKPLEGARLAMFEAYELLDSSRGKGATNVEEAIVLLKKALQNS